MEWLNIRERVVRPGTWQADSAAITKWIIPTIGSRPLAGLQRSDVRAVHSATADAGLADTSSIRIHATLRKLLSDATEEGHDVPERTLRTTRVGGPGITQRAAMTVDDARRVLHVAMGRQDASRWVAAILQGMRPAEALGLRWSAVDLDRGLMRIEWQLKHLPYRIPRDRTSGFRTPIGFESIHLDGTAHLVRPKTAAGLRVVPLVPWLRVELAAWSAVAPQGRHDLVWSNNGTPKAAELDRSEWQDLATEADVWVTRPDGSKRRPLLYECRHTAATMLMASGVDETTLTAIVGHSKIASTRAYLHTDTSRQLAALESVGAALGLTA